MPTYEYLCQACDHEFEAFQSITAKPLRKCPECGKSRVKRKIGIGAGVIFKGSGFYETDYRSESYKQAEKAEKSGTDKGGDKSTDKASAKTEPKTAGSGDNGSIQAKPAASTGSSKPKPAKAPAKA